MMSGATDDVGVSFSGTGLPGPLPHKVSKAVIARAHEELTSFYRIISLIPRNTPRSIVLRREYFS